MKQAQQVRVRIGVFELDLKTGELCAGDLKNVLQEQPLQILRMLIEAEGELVSREEIRKKLWPNDTIVEFDHSINTVIRNLRRVLGDSAEEPKYIQTVARRGYRLMVSVERVTTGDSSAGDAGGAEAAVQLRPEPTLFGKKVSHYRVLDIIGGGGMGLVYKAEDLRLGREVALKFLPEDLVSDQVALQRFEREARTASSLDHPNICTIYEVEEDESQPFIVMQLLRGETLRDRLLALASLQQRLQLDELLDITVQIASGLEAAHAKGIIHRDIKPANIFLTSIGQVKILDFGLAKLVSSVHEIEGDGVQLEPGGAAAAPRRAKVVPPDSTLTRFGTALGTAGYMSPEQIRGEKLDARSDIFSFGLMLYEMATGHRAFGGETQAVLHDAIQHSEPTPVRDLAPNIPLQLEAVINKCLQKQPDQRFQSVAEVRTGLSNLQQSLRFPPSLAEEQKKRSPGRASIAIAIGAVLFLAIAVALIYRRVFPTPKLTSADTIVLAEFENNTGDQEFDGSLTAGLGTALQQTPFLNILASDKVDRVLKEMGRSDREPLTYDRAKEVCAKTNSAAVVTGAIADAGNQYKLDLKAVRCDTGAVIASAGSFAGQQDLVIKQLGLAAVTLRTQLGEPRKTLQDFNKPLETATTSSVSAMRAVTLGQRYIAAGKPRLAVDYFRRAVDRDSNYAWAYCALGGALGNSVNPQEARENLRKAYELRDRVTPLQRFLIDFQYFSLVTADLEKGRTVLREGISIYPNNTTERIVLSWALGELGRYEEAAAEARESIRLDPDNVSPYLHLVHAEIGMQRYDEAKAAFEAARAHGLDFYELRLYMAELAFLEGDGGLLREQVSWLLEHARPDVAWELRGDIAAYHGQMKDARRFFSKGRSLAARSPLLEPAAESLTDEAMREAGIGNDDLAKHVASQALTLAADREATSGAAFAFALAGELKTAEKLAEQLNREQPQSTIVQNFDLPCIRAVIAIRQGDSAEAIRMLQSTRYDLAEGDLMMLSPIYVRGQAYLQAGRTQEAANEFEKIISHPGTGGNKLNPWGPAARLQLARAQVMMGDKAAARKSYQDFLTLWKDADPDIPIYKQAKAEYAKLQ